MWQEEKWVVVGRSPVVCLVLTRYLVRLRVRRLGSVLGVAPHLLRAQEYQLVLGWLQRLAVAVG